MVGQRSADKRVPDVRLARLAGGQAGLPAGAVRRATARRRCCRATRSRSRTRPAARGWRAEVQQLLLEFGVVSRQCRVRQRRDQGRHHQPPGRPDRSPARSASSARKQTKLRGRARRRSRSTRRRMSAATTCRSSRTSSARTARRRWTERDWLRRHNVDRIERWERDGDEIRAHITDAEARRGRRAAGRRPLLLRRGRRRSRTPACSRSTRSGSTPTTTPSSPTASSATTPSAGSTPLAMEMVRDIDEETVDFSPNYDGTPAGADGAAGAVPQPAGQRRSGASRSAWRPTSRRTTCARSPTACMWYLEHPDADRGRAARPR